MVTGYKSLLDKIRKRGEKTHGNLFQDSDLANGARTALVKYAIINPNVHDVHALYIGLKEYAFDVFKRYVAGEDKAAQDYATLEKATVGIRAKGSSLNMFQILHYTCTHILNGSIDHGSFRDSYKCGLTPSAEAPRQETEYARALDAKNEVEKVRSWRTFRRTNDTLVGDALLNKMEAEEFEFEDAPDEPRGRNSTASVAPSRRICGPRYVYKKNTATRGSLVQTRGMPDATFCQRVPGTCLYKRRGIGWTCCPKTKAPVFGYDDCSVPLRDQSKRVQTRVLKRLFMALNKDNEDAFVDEKLIDNTIKRDDKCITTNTDNQIIAVVVKKVEKGEVTVKRIIGKRSGRGKKKVPNNPEFNVRPHKLVKLTDVNDYATFMKNIQDRYKALKLLRKMLDPPDLAKTAMTALTALAIGDVVVYYKNKKLWVATVVSKEASKVTVTRKNTEHQVDIDIGDILSRHKLCKSSCRFSVGTKVVVQELDDDDWFDVDLNRYITDKGELRNAFVGEVKPRKKGKKGKDSHDVQKGTKTITVKTNLIYRPLD